VTIECEDGTKVTVEDGRDGLDVGTSAGLVATLQVSSPASGAFFTTGESIVVSIMLEDLFGYALTLDELSRADLYVYGPGGVQNTKTALGLLRASGDRANPSHHRVDLKTTTSSSLVVSGDSLTYTLAPISIEPAGTYTVGLWVVRADDGYAQAFEMVDVQIGTDTKVNETVGGCADCHRGTNGKMYLAHIDPGYSPTGNWSLDMEPVRSCKACHNQDGYAAYSRCSDGTRPNGTTCAGGALLESMSDPTIRRVHGVHRGEGLLTPFDVDAVNGDFKAYTDVVFPADIRRCDKCHRDDSWKTKPSRIACGTCHDNLDFATGHYSPPITYKTMACTDATVATACASIPAAVRACSAAVGGFCQRTQHLGGAATDDSTCGACHGAESGSAPIVANHAPAVPTFVNAVELALTPSATGGFYTNEAPVLHVTVKDSSGNVVAPSAITEASFKRANIMVSGPRSDRRAVLTTAAAGAAAARATTTSAKAGPWNLTGAIDLELVINGTPVTVPVASGTFASTTAATAAEVATWLNGDAAFAPLATASAAAGKVTIKSDIRGAGSSIAVSASSSGTDLRALMGWTTSTVVATAYYTAANDYRVRYDPLDEDPRVTRTATELQYQLGSVAGLRPGTYVIWVEAGSAYPTASASMTFQVGTATPEKMVATNCTSCHGQTTMHAGYFAVPFDTDICGSCHDYTRQIPGAVGWGATINMGFGAGPLSRRIHGTHYLAYLDKPEQVYSEYATKHFIFPQDVRNCETCHTETTTWTTKPGRLACNGCHDSDAAIAHSTLQTYDPTPLDAWSGDEVETCEACHGKDRDYAASIVHNVSDPYRAPYPREPKE
jgi:hypothetical protein